MSKLQVEAKITLRNEVLTEDVSGSIENGIINYQEHNNTHVYIDINRDELLRENDELILKYVFDSHKLTKGKITVKKLNQELDIEIKTNSIDKEVNSYRVEYEIEGNLFYYEIRYWEV